MNIQPWKILESHYVHPGIRVDRCQLSNGHTLTPHILEYDDEVMVFAMTRDHQVLLVRQYRHGVAAVVLDLPGGSVDEGESPLEAVKRELLEETGYSSDTFLQVGHISPNAANYTNKLYCFLALNAEQTSAQSVHDAESVEVVLTPLDEVIRLAKRGDLASCLNLSTLFLVLVQLGRVS